MPSLRRSLRALALVGIGLAGANLLVRRAAGRREDIELATTAVPGSVIDVDGRRVHYVEAGTGSPILLIHGWNGSTFDMRYTIAELSRQYRVIAPDLLGYGYSARPPDGDYSLAGQAAFVISLMDRLGIQRASVLGHSMGGAIAMQLALRHPERIDRLILVASATAHEMMRGRTIGLLARPIVPLATLLFVRESMVQRGLRRAVHDPEFVTPEVLEGHYRPLRMKGHMRASMLQLSDRRKDPPFDAREIRQPTLIIWGEHDRVVPLARGLELAEQIPNAQLAIIRSAGHLVLEEQPVECARALLPFLERPLQRPAAPSNGGVHELTTPVN